MSSSSSEDEPAVPASSGDAFLMHVDTSEEAPSVPVAEDKDESSKGEPESLPYAAGGNEVPVVAVPQARASEFVELRGLLADARSLLAALDDHQRSLQTRLDAHKRRMLQTITGVEQREIVVERSIIQLQGSVATRNEVTFLRSALTSAGIVPFITEDVMAIARARSECSCWPHHQVVAPTRATYSIDSPRHQADRGYQESNA
ncbi:hypothetical protein NE237_003486 [Protea cynaroides]|uniref:Uncharacterized protein n=1 Tax=Protea cynaroides TaxID=273540 RepID=A0A9Q0KH27_9MAGN|nr:hypothetical protein NE237_003486 [Protea cynaroides]